MIRHRAARAASREEGFTLVELLVTVILIGILAAIVLAVFLGQKDKGNDADAKSDVNNLARLVQACNASNDTGDDYRSCDSPTEVSDTGLDVSSELAVDPGAADCADPADTDTVAAG